MRDEQVKKMVREGYARIARSESSCCGPTEDSCCDSNETSSSKCCGDEASASSTCCGDGSISQKIGYSAAEISSVPEGADLGLGCGNPTALAALEPGQTVLDLGSGAGFDCFLAADRVGAEGQVIGVDMTPEMLEKARNNAREGKYDNVEFRLGEIEALPVADGSVDVVISNCVINLVPNKARVFREAFRALRPGGYLMISDIVILRELPGPIRDSVQAYIGCLAGAVLKKEYLGAITEAGFEQVEVLRETSFSLDCMENDPTAQAVMEELDLSGEKVSELARGVVSVTVHAVKPG